MFQTAPIRLDIDKCVVGYSDFRTQLILPDEDFQGKEELLYFSSCFVVVIMWSNSEINL